MRGALQFSVTLAVALGVAMMLAEYIEMLALVLAVR